MLEAINVVVTPPTVLVEVVDPLKIGPAGADGKTIRNGSGVPSPSTGVDGDFYIDISAHTIYGPKTSGLWGSSTSIVGPTGATGATGNSGTDGKTVRSGSGVPLVGLGVDGDFYIDTTASTLYGPKTAGVWGGGVSLIGPTGATGAAGSNGTNGSNGLNADMTRTSTDSVTIGTGSKTLSYSASSNLGWAVGTRLRATKSTDTASWIEGAVTAVSTTSVTITSDIYSGSGTVSSWIIGIAGQPASVVNAATYADIPVISGDALIKVAADETNAGFTTLYLQSGVSRYWIPTVGV